MICVPRGIILMPLNLLPIFQLILSIPNSIPCGASKSNKTPSELNLSVAFSYIIAIINEIIIFKRLSKLSIEFSPFFKIKLDLFNLV